jgi:anti-sigma factor RsiW
VGLALAPALVLGAVTAEERQQLVVHLEGCSSCRALAARLARGAVVLPLELDPVEPPARLHGRVLAAVAAARQEVPPAPSRRSPSLLPRPRSLYGHRLRGVPLGLAAAAALAFVLGTGLGVGIGHVRAPLTPASPGPGSEVARYSLHGTGSMSGVTATAVSLKRDGVTFIDFKGMPQLSAEQVYEL